jgi:3,4-dihydroxy 2-butanone 4-phosphate synthase/GTP cyclohydrolase II
MPSIKHLDSAVLPTGQGEFRAHAFSSVAGNKADQDILVLVFGEVKGRDGVLTRIHSSCLTGDVFGSNRCDCGAQLQLAMQMIVQEKNGLIIYLPQEGRGIGLGNKIRAYALQDTGQDTVDANLALGFPADTRNYSVCADIFAHFRIGHLRLLSNNPHKINSLQSLGLQVERVALQTPAGSRNTDYLCTKRDRLGHLLDI